MVVRAWNRAVQRAVGSLLDVKTLRFGAVSQVRRSITTEHKSAYRAKLKALYPNDAKSVDKGVLLLDGIVAISKDKGTDSVDHDELDRMAVQVGINQGEFDQYVEVLEEQGMAIRISSLRRTERMVNVDPVAMVGQMNILMDQCGPNHNYREMCRLQALEELSALEEEKKQIEQSAIWRTRFKMIGSSTVVTGYVAGCAYLTAVVFSWDVMEPLTYFFGGFVNVAFLMYAGLRKEEFDFGRQYEDWKLSGYDSICKSQKFDFSRYHALKEYVNRLE
ncbi:hypothetical protein AAMO2058_000066300 [Amorphochlora amoebiformis]